VKPFALILTAFLLLLLFLLLHADYLPMIDLPQHAAQITSWIRLQDPAFPDHRLYELNLRTPYLVAYGLAKLMAPWVGVVAGLKLVLWLGIAGNALAVTSIARATGHSQWLGLLALPTAVGYSFYFGFISFVFTTPFALCCWRVALAHARRPRASSALLLGALLVLVFSAHAFGFVVALCGAAALLLEGLNRRTLILRTLPLLPAALLCASWLPGLWRHGYRGGEVWELGVSRLLSVPALLVGLSGADAELTALGIFVMLALATQLGRVHASRARWLPLLGILLGFLFLPLQLRSVGFVYPRLVAFLLPAALIAFRPREASARWAGSAPALLAVSISGGWLGLFATRLANFQREAAGFSSLVAGMPWGLAVRPIVFERECLAFPGVGAFLHFPAYYQVQKGGTQGYSFARYETSVIRERALAPPVMVDGAEWHPQTFDATREVPHFDFFMVHSLKDRTQQLFGDSPEPVKLVANHGDWWGYSVVRPAHQP